MFDACVIGTGKNCKSKEVWCSLPRKDVDKSLYALDYEFKEWIITKCEHENLKIHIEKYQTGNKHDDLKRLNMLAMDYNVLTPEEKTRIIDLSNNGKEFEELVSDIIDEKVRKIALNTLNNPLELMRALEIFKDSIM